MKILIIGGGGREHALAWRLAQCPSVTGLIASPGNPGMLSLARCIPAPADLDGYVEIAEANAVDLTVVGPEATLVQGIVDLFRSRGLKIVGPTRAAAQLEGSKVFAKEFFRRAGIPTARSAQVASVQDGLDALKGFGLPVVIKADGLAAGKGVIIANTAEEAAKAVQQLGPTLVIEEFLEGEEVSFIGLSNGKTVVPFAPSQDHKRIFDGDQGPNTGGMGAYADTRILTGQQTSEIMDQIMLRAVGHMAAERTEFTGFLYAGLMMTADGPKVLEFNVRMGDPETQALMYGFQGDLGELLMTGQGAPSWPTPSVSVVLAAAGYPQTPRTGDVITGLESAVTAGGTVFHAGTAIQNGSLVTAGGRVLGVTAGADGLAEAIDRTYAALEPVHFEGMQYRRDIGQKGLRRW